MNKYASTFLALIAIFVPKQAVLDSIDTLHVQSHLLAEDDVRQFENLNKFTYSNDSSRNWWQPKASDNLIWYITYQGNINTEIPADVFFLDGDVSQSVINTLKSRGKKVMCYISVGSLENWRSDFSAFPDDVIGNDYTGWPGEAWLDVSNIAALAPLLRARLDQCQSKGFDGIDADNVNGYANNTGFEISKSHAIRFIKWLAVESHSRGLAFSLKNSEDLASEVVNEVDMLQTESCSVYSNCRAASVIVDANKPVWMLEYEGVNDNWLSACNLANSLGFSAIYRDVLLTGNGVYEVCSMDTN